MQDTYINYLKVIDSNLKRNNIDLELDFENRLDESIEMLNLFLYYNKIMLSTDSEYKVSGVLPFEQSSSAEAYIKNKLFEEYSDEWQKELNQLLEQPANAGKLELDENLATQFLNFLNLSTEEETKSSMQDIIKMASVEYDEDPEYDEDEAEYDSDSEYDPYEEPVSGVFNDYEEDEVEYEEDEYDIDEEDNPQVDESGVFNDYEEEEYDPYEEQSSNEVDEYDPYEEPESGVFNDYEEDEYDSDEDDETDLEDSETIEQDNVSSLDARKVDNSLESPYADYDEYEDFSEDSMESYGIEEDEYDSDEYDEDELDEDEPDEFEDESDEFEEDEFEEDEFEEDEPDEFEEDESDEDELDEDELDEDEPDEEDESDEEDEFEDEFESDEDEEDEDLFDDFDYDEEDNYDIPQDKLDQAKAAVFGTDSLLEGVSGVLSAEPVKQEPPKPVTAIQTADAFVAKINKWLAKF